MLVKDYLMMGISVSDARHLISITLAKEDHTRALPARLTLPSLCSRNQFFQWAWLQNSNKNNKSFQDHDWNSFPSAKADDCHLHSGNHRGYYCCCLFSVVVRELLSVMTNALILVSVNLLNGKRKNPSGIKRFVYQVESLKRISRKNGMARFEINM